MKDIAIFGAGGFGREVACLINMINKKTPTWNFIGFFDDGKDKGCKNEYGEILGGIRELNEWQTPLAIAIAIGNPQTVKYIVDNIQNNQVEYPNIIAPTTIFLDKNNIEFGKGNIVCSCCLFSCNVKVGDFNIFNGYITVGHDVTMGNFNSLMPAVRISGEVNLGNCNYIGVASIILQTLRIGDNTTVGAGSVVVRKTKDGYTYVGNPAKKIEY